MYFKALPLSIAIVSLMSSMAEAKTVPSTAVYYVSPPAAVVDAYWSPERLKNATPMDMPRVDAKKMKNAIINNTEEPSVGEDGKPPEVDLLPNTNPLYTPDVHTKASIQSQPGNVGTVSAHFTSSQLIPTSAYSTYPYRTVGKLFFTTPSGDKTCTAVVLKNRIIVTAGHCLHNGNGDTSGWYTNFKFMPGFTNSTAPYYTWTSTFGMVPTGWFTGGGTIPNAVDYGMLEMADQTINSTVRSLGSITGSLGYQTNATIPNHAHIIGYSNNFDGGNLIHQVTAQSARAVDANNVEYGSDLSVGAGGSPWIQNFGKASAGQTMGLNQGSNRLIGVSSYAYNDTTTLMNGGPILDSTFVNLLNTMCGHQTGNC